MASGFCVQTLRVGKVIGVNIYKGALYLIHGMIDALCFKGEGCHESANTI